MRNVTSLYVYLFLLFMTRAVKIACPLSFLCLIPGCTRHFSRLGISSMCTTVFTVNIKMKDMLLWEFDKYQSKLASSHARYPGCQTLLNRIQPIFKVLNQLKKSGHPYYQFFEDFSSYKQRCLEDDKDGHELLFNKDIYKWDSIQPLC